MSPNRLVWRHKRPSRHPETVQQRNVQSPAHRCIFSGVIIGVVGNLVIFSLLHSWAVHNIQVLNPSGGWNDLLASPLEVVLNNVVNARIRDDDYDSSIGSNYGAKVQKLEFVHITKTAGSAIEEAAARSGVKWGVCHWKRVGKFGPICMYQDWFTPRPKYNRLVIPFRFNKTLGEPWHTPPHWLRQNPYVGSDTFCVVRNPYDRIVSEYYCKFAGYRGDDANNATVMNNWIQQRLGGPKSKMKVHRLPQHMYVYNMQGKKVIDHVLRYEHLDDDFASLMNLYELNVALPKRMNARNTTKSILTTLNLTADTIQVINARYFEDFRLFNYSVIK